MTPKIAALALVAINLASDTTAFSAYAQTYPSRPITLVVPFGPGGSIDSVGRMLGEHLSARLGKTLVIENRPGGGTNVATAGVARAAPDGHTLLITTSSLAINATLYKSIPYDPGNDLTPVALVANIPLVLLVNPSLPARSVAELVTLAKKTPGSLSYASSGPGSAPHLAAELFKHMAGIDMTHVPYRGVPQALTDVVAGHVHVLFADPGSAVPHMRDGKIRALGVTSLTRAPAIPDLVPIAESGVPTFNAVSWQLIVAPAKTSPEIINRLHGTIKSITSQPDIETQFAKLGLIPADSPSPDELRAFVTSEIARWGEIVRRAGVAGSE